MNSTDKPSARAEESAPPGDRADQRRAATVPSEPSEGELRELRDARTEVLNSRDSLTSAAEVPLARAETVVSGRANSSPVMAARVGRFAILRELGRGGMGQVFLAYDETLDRKVAVKVLHGGTHHADAERRFRREAQAMARIAHPNVAAIHEVGVMSGRVFIAMELIPGQTLREWTGEPGRDWRAILAMYVQAGRGLIAAHRADIVHRDFKPENVLVGTDGRARVLDFGLARMAASQTGERDASATGPERESSGFAGTEPPLPLGSEPLTRVGSIMGTPVYMSPEQHDGRAADARSDQYNFCVALYEALYGTLPFEARTMSRLMAAKRAGPPAQPRGLAAELVSVHELLVRGLAVDAEARWPSMTELVDELEAHIRDTPTHTQRLNRYQYLVLGGLGLLGAVGILIGDAAYGGMQNLSNQSSVLIKSLGTVAILALRIAARRHLEGNLLANRIIWLLFIAMMTITAHSAIGMYLDMPFEHVFPSEFLIMGGIAAIGGVAIHRWYWLMSVQFFALAGFLAMYPSYLGHCFAISMLDLTALALALWLKGQTREHFRSIRIWSGRTRSSRAGRTSQHENDESAGDA